MTERRESLPMATESFSASRFDATFTHLSRCLRLSVSVAPWRREFGTYGFERVLIDAFIAQWFQLRPVKCRFSRTWATTEEDNIQSIPLLDDDGSC